MKKPMKWEGSKADKAEDKKGAEMMKRKEKAKTKKGKK